MRSKKLLLFFPVVVALFSLFQGIFLGRVLVDLDYLFQQIPFRSFAHSEILSGRLPYVFPYSLLGVPLIAHGQIGMFFPLTFLTLIFKDQFLAYYFELVILFSAGFYGEYLFSAFYLNKKTERILASLYYAFSPFLFVHIIHLNLIIPFILLPYSLYFVRKAQKNAKYLPVLTVIFTLVFLSFHPQAAMIHVVITFIYAIFFSGSIKNMSGLVKATIVAVFLAGIQIVPFVFLRFSGRFASHKGLNWMAQGAFDPLISFPLFFIPLPYLRTPIYNTATNGEIYLYITGFLGIVVFLFSKRLKYEHRDLIPVVVLGFFLMLVKYNPLYAIFAKIPVLNSVRCHIRWWGGVLPFVSIMVSSGLKEMSEHVKLKRDILILGLLPVIWAGYFVFAKLAAGDKWFYLFNVKDKVNIIFFVLWAIFSVMIVSIRHKREVLFVVLLTVEIISFSNLLYTYTGRDAITKTIADFEYYKDTRFASVALDLDALDKLFFVRKKTHILRDFTLFGTFFHGNFSCFLHAYNIFGYVAPQLEPQYVNKIRHSIYSSFSNKGDVNESCRYLEQLHVDYLMSFEPVLDSACLSLKETKDGMFIYSVLKPKRISMNYQNGLYTVSSLVKDSTLIIPVRYLPGLIAIDKKGRKLKMDILSPYLIKVHTGKNNTFILKYRPLWVYYGAVFSLIGVILFLLEFVVRRKNA